MIDKSYCMSSYLSLRYVEDDDKQFFEGLRHQVYKQQPCERKEFREDIDINKYNGNQKWLLYCLERFLNYFENKTSSYDGNSE